MRRSELVERDRGRKYGAYVTTIRTLLRLTNALLALLGLAMLGYAVYMYLKFQGTEFPSSPAPVPNQNPSSAALTAASGAPAMQQLSMAYDPPPLPGPLPPPPPAHKLAFPWFIFAFGAAGTFTFLAAATGLAGVSWNSRALLGIYSVLLVLMLVAQAAVAIALFTDKSWQKYLPPDETGEVKRIERFVRGKLEVCRWVGLAVLLVQLISLGLAYMVSSAQQRVLEASDDEDDAVWGRRMPLLTSEGSAAIIASERGEAGSAHTQRGVPPGAGDSSGGPDGGRSDPWSTRMREKYGLDTAQFSYNPEAGAGRAASAAAGGGARLTAQGNAPGQEQRRCAVM